MLSSYSPELRSSLRDCVYDCPLDMCNKDAHSKAIRLSKACPTLVQAPRFYRPSKLWLRVPQIHVSMRACLNTGLRLHMSQRRAATA